ncbi:GTPase HflX [Lachnoclostridium sp. Marseille-P6806]|uniref:GTPase HflX n=1 Tax=Lachnoclostridium sp. Marseille-P6806 TaxID=2364793 RepID=UPI00102F3C0B|nr:GTPase HflX [Lachnoclostridium sp. Marseille-P6806]
MTEMSASCILISLHRNDLQADAAPGAAEEEERSLRELEGLAEAASFRVRELFRQNVPKISAGTYIGTGKAQEIKAYLELADTEEPIDAVIVNDAISPVQLANLSDIFDRPVIDRTGLILRIFADRARTREAKLQVESARLQYMLPRLQGMHRELGRQGGGSGALSNRGAGETKIELDRRRIEHRLAELRRELAVVERERTTQRSRRLSAGIPRVSLVGYTNAGKSSIMNAMLDLYGGAEDKKVLEKNMLFATLDTAVRRIEPGEEGRPFLLTDTVGFVRKLPTALVRAFRSTLEDAALAGLLLIVTDLSAPDCAAQLRTTLETLRDIGAGEVPRIFVFNKADAADAAKREVPPRFDGIGPEDGRITICAKKPEDIRRLVALTEQKLDEGSIECDMRIPYSEGCILAELQSGGLFTVLDYGEDGMLVHVRCSRELYRRCTAYVLEKPQEKRSPEAE